MQGNRDQWLASALHPLASLDTATRIAVEADRRADDGAERAAPQRRRPRWRAWTRALGEWLVRTSPSRA